MSETQREAEPMFSFRAFARLTTYRGPSRRPVWCPAWCRGGLDRTPGGAVARGVESRVVAVIPPLAAAHRVDPGVRTHEADEGWSTTVPDFAPMYEIAGDHSLLRRT